MSIYDAEDDDVISGSSLYSSIGHPFPFIRDDLRSVFNEFDREGFGEIPLDTFESFVLSDAYFQSRVSSDKLVVLANKSKDLRQMGANVLTFQEFVSVLSNKRTNSFKKALNEIAKSSSVKPRSLYSRFKALMGKEVLGSESDIKYNEVRHGISLPLTIPLLSSVQIGFFLYNLYHTPYNPETNIFIYRSRSETYHQVWRLFTYSFVHSDEFHLIINVLIQLIVGIPLETVHGSPRIMFIYTTGVLSGPLISSIVEECDLIGSSGGSYALFTSQLINTAKNYSHLKMPFFRLIFLLAIASTEVGVGIYRRYAPFSSYNNVGYLAHITGSASGVIVGLVILRNFEQRLRQRVYWWISIGVFAGIVLFVLFYHAIYAKVIISWGFV